MTVLFHLQPEDQALVNQAVERWSDFCQHAGLEMDRLSCEMDMAACHLNGCPLDLAKLLAFDEFDFVHDMAGIRNCLDRTTGKLTQHFLPRCARH